MLRELKKHLVGAYIQKINQPTHEIVILQTYAGEKFRLLISISREARIHITEQKYTNPAMPFAFCMLLRKHLTGAVIKDIVQLNRERTLDISLQKRDREFVLRAELMGTQSNLVLLSDKNIFGAAQNQVGQRTFTPNSPYPLLNSDSKLDPFDMDEAQFLKNLNDEGESPLETALVTVLDGIGPQTAREICTRADIDARSLANALSTKDQRLLTLSIQDLIHSIRSEEIKPVVYYTSEQPIECTPVPYKIYEHLKSQQLDSFSSAFDHIYGQSLQEPIADEVSSATKEINKRIKKIERAIKGATNDLEKAKEYDEIRIKGDLIMAKLSEIEKGSTQVELEDYDGTRQLIALDPKLNAVENAQAFYARYKKLKRGVDKIEARVSELKSELAHLENVREELSQADSSQHVQDLELELDLGPGVRHNAPHDKSQPPGSGPRMFEFMGYRIFVGRNGKQNDALIRNAHKEDMWFHVKDRPGSHVVVQTQRNQKVPKDVIERAAELAAYYSRAQGATKADVMYTRVKHLKKPKGANPGQVLVSKEEGTITVRPRGEE